MDTSIKYNIQLKPEHKDIEVYYWNNKLAGNLSYVQMKRIIDKKTSFRIEPHSVYKDVYSVYFDDKDECTFIIHKEWLIPANSQLEFSF